MRFAFTCVILGGRDFQMPYFAKYSIYLLFSIYLFIKYSIYTNAKYSIYFSFEEHVYLL